ncbi:AraC family ligand binding domain-containing protein [Vibrio zhugei]|uniref:AraC family ligand binding domain-containing protein n=1 Tax=Vibrio zhugei TaxID=2479546 RepID=A0ABV7CB71_9VIBR|nr:AraC family ligand binding domain-containing protein [Vibrio zhugei]
MNYAIQCDTRHFPTLHITARKRANKHSFIHVQQGLLLCRLGKYDYAIEAGQSFWIPLDCLCALTCFPNTRYTCVDFSVRLRDAFPHQAGYITPTNLTSSALERLQQIDRDDPLFVPLTQIMRAEVTRCVPHLSQSQLTNSVSTWTPEHSAGLAQEQHMVLLVREAIKRKQSGQATETLLSELFAGDRAFAEQWMQVIAGRSLDKK